jgi:hypothetical protein
VGAVQTGLRLLSTTEAIRGAIKKKASRYGEMDRPYVIAVNVLSWHVDDVDLVDAMFGDLVYAVQETPAGSQRWSERTRTGAWRGPPEPRYRRVTAVLFFNEIDPWTAARRRALLLHNPWAHYPLPRGLFGVPEWSWPSGGRREVFPGAPMCELLGLTGDWPVADDDMVDLG